MNEKAPADRVQQDLHNLLGGGPLPAPQDPQEYEQVLNVARLLASSDLSAQSRVQKPLKQALLSRSPLPASRKVWLTNLKQGNHTMKYITRMRAFGLAAFLAVTLMLAASQIPPVQAFAQQIWQQVGPLIIVNKPIPTEQAAIPGSTPTPLPGAGSVAEPLPPLTGPTPRPGEGTGREQPAGPHASPTPLPVTQNFEPLSDEMALEKYGFQVLQPAHLPEDYQLTEHQVSRTQDGRISSIFVYTTNSTAFDAPYLSIQQSTYQEEAPIEFLVGDANVSQVSLRGLTATFIEDARLMTVRDDAGENVTLPVDYLMWEEGGLFFVVDATTLTQAEMIQIAESLR